MNMLSKYLSFLFMISNILYAADTAQPTNNTSHTGKRFNFNFTNKSLVDLINELAAAKNINIILPQGAFAIPATTTVSYHIPEPISIDQAWKQLIVILDMAGYTITRDGNLTSIVKIDSGTPSNNVRQPLPIFINEPLENLPDTEQVIKALFYLQNLSIEKSQADLTNILKDMLSTTAAGAAPSGTTTAVGIIFEPKTNALILTDKACNIKSVMTIILELDKGGIRDSIEIIPLYYTSASTIETLFNTDIFQIGQQKDSFPDTKSPAQATYFPKSTKVSAIARTNSLVIMGTPYAIDLVKDFVIKYIDKPLESGASILHIYDLQYLDATTCADTLNNLVKPKIGVQTEVQVVTGAKQYFKDVVIVAEIKSTTETLAPTAITGGGATAPSTKAQVGGNRLIIAARRQDWIRIEKLIKDIDKPQAQVALEVLVIDVTLDSNKSIGSQMRNREGFNDSISKNINFQTAHLTQPLLRPEVNEIRPADALMVNLLRLGISPLFGDEQNIANTSTPGSFIISLNDNKESGIWSVWRIINNYSNSTILAQPFILTKNHVKGTVTIAEKRFLEGAASTQNVAASVARQYVDASLVVDMLPHISSSGNINLQITVNVNEFISESNNSRITRIVQTNANIGNNQVLALGGLTRIKEDIGNDETPLLGKIPVFGWFFKRSAKIKTKNNLVILICPTVIEPKALGGINPYTQSKLDFAQNNLDEHLLFENLHDPITRWFFKPDPCYGQNIVEGYKRETAEHINDTTEPIFGNNTKDHATPPSPIETSETERLKKMVHYEENPLSSQEVKKQADLQ